MLDRGGRRFVRTAMLAAMIAGWIGVSAAAAAPDRSRQIAAYEAELQALATELEVPGYAYAIVEDGKVVASRGFGVGQEDEKAPFTTASMLRIASVTKALTAVMAMQLVEEGKLDLTTPANRFARNEDLPDAVQVQHLLTHSSEGIPGDEFVYGTIRYSRLAPVIATASGQSFEQAMRTRIIERAGMRWHESEQLGAHGGLVSSVDDMAAYIEALDRGALLSEQSLRRLATPSELRPGRLLPVSLGWFVQDVQGERVMWSYGQDDPDHSGALMLRLPGRKLTLFLMANSNVISDAFRLLMGDVRKSPFAMSFMRLFAFSKPGRLLPPLPKDAGPEWLDAHEAAPGYSYSDELAAAALVDAWRERKAQAQAKIDLLIRRYGLGERPDAVLHFAVMQLGAGTHDAMAAEWGRRLLADHPNNRWILLVQGYLLQRMKQKEGASDCLERIVALPNQERDFLHLLFNSWSWTALAEMNRESDPERARKYLEAVVESGVKGPTLEKAEQALKEMDASPH